MTIRKTAAAVGTVVGLADDEHVLQVGVIDLVAHGIKDLLNGICVGIDDDIAVIVVESDGIAVSHIQKLAAGIRQIVEIGVVGLKSNEDIQFFRIPPLSSRRDGISPQIWIYYYAPLHSKP